MLSIGYVFSHDSQLAVYWRGRSDMSPSTHPCASYISPFYLYHYFKPAGDIKEGLYNLFYSKAYCMAGRRKWELQWGKEKKKEGKR